MTSKKQKVLMKRLKGKYKQDMKNIMKYAELDEKDASDYAFMVQKSWHIRIFCASWRLQAMEEL